MIKKSLTILSVSVAFFLNAQNTSVIKNTAEVYSNTSLPGTAKYNAMAGSMGALGGDVSVLNSNPAGLGVAIATDIGGTLFVQNTTNRNTYAGSTLEYCVDDTDIGQAGGLIAIELNGATPWKFITIGANYSSQSIEDYSETPSNTNISLSDGTDYLNFEGHAYDRYGSISKMSFGVGGNYDNKLYVGLGVNFLGADLRQYDSTAFTYNDTTTEVFDRQYTPYDETSAGFSASIGVIGKIGNQFRLGAALETPTWWSIDRVYTEYSDYDDVYGEGRDLTTPLKTTLSAAFVPNKNLAINVDYTLGLTKPKYKVRGDAETELNDFFNDYYKNMSEVKFGAEYRIQQFRVRAGYAFANSPFDSVGLTQYNTDGTTSDVAYKDMFLGKRNTYGIGLGYDFRSFYIDATYQNVSSEYKSPSTYGDYYSYSYALSSDAHVVSNVETKKDNFFFTIGWKF